MRYNNNKICILMHVNDCTMHLNNLLTLFKRLRKKMTTCAISSIVRVGCEVAIAPLP